MSNNTPSRSILIDGTHTEETRVVVMTDDQLDEFEFEHDIVKIADYVNKLTPSQTPRPTWTPTPIPSPRPSVVPVWLISWYETSILSA